MSTVCQRWKDGFGPIGAGLYFPDDTFCPAHFDPAQRTLAFDQRQPLDGDAEFASYLDYDTGRFCSEVGVIRWGGGPWEGEGWIAVEGHDSLPLWILHFDDSEPFTQARYESGLIEAVAHEYPAMSVFTIPVTSPHLATITTEPDQT